MPFPAIRVSRNWLPALIVTALFHVLVFLALVYAIPKQFERHVAATSETITYLPMIPPLPVKKRAGGRAAPGSGTITPYFNPYTFRAPPALQPNLLGLQTALGACAPENYDMASVEIRTVCGKIGALLRQDPEHFGVAQDVTDPKHWQRELVRREAPYLAPCMSPRGFEPLYTLYCVYKVLMHGYDPEKMQRYSE